MAAIQRILGPVPKATTTQRLQKAIDGELKRLQSTLDTFPGGLRGVMFSVKLKPDGAVRVVITQLDIENAGENDGG